MYCEQCGAKNDDGTKFCTSCGANIGGDGGEQPKVITENATKPLSGFAKTVIISVVAIVVIAVVGVFGYRFILDNFGDKEGYEDHPLIYVKNELVFMKHTNKKEAWPLTEKYGYYANNEYDGEGVQYVQLSSDGKLIFFADDIDGEDFKLYYRKTNQVIHLLWW